MAATAYRYLVQIPGTRGGKTIIEGTRIGVHDVIGLLQNGETVDTVCSRSCFPDITKAQVYECLAYYEDHKDEIDLLVEEQMAEPEMSEVALALQLHSSERLLKFIMIEGKRIELKEPMAISLIEKEGHFYAENEELTLFGSGETEVAALEDFHSFLAGTWEGLRDQPDAELDASAQVLRDKLQKHFSAA